MNLTKINFNPYVYYNYFLDPSSIDAKIAGIVLLFHLLILIIILIYLFFIYRKKRMIEDTPTSKIRSATQGFIELNGTGYCLPDIQIKSGLQQLDCIWFSYKVEQEYIFITKNPDGSSIKKQEWRILENAVSKAPFLLDDSTDICVIYPEKSTVHMENITHTWVGYACDRQGLKTIPFKLFGFKLFDYRQPSVSSFLQGRGPRYRYTEHVLPIGSPIHAMGIFETHNLASDDKLLKSCEHYIRKNNLKYRLNNRVNSLHGKDIPRDQKFYLSNIDEKIVLARLNHKLQTYLFIAAILAAHNLYAFVSIM